METMQDLLNLIPSNPKAKEQEIVEALRIFALLEQEVDKEYKLAIPYSSPAPEVELAGEDQPQQVTLVAHR